jgi:hypothetical protein
MIYKPVAYIIRDIISQIRDNFTTEKIIPYYEFGTTLEVVNTLSLKSESSAYYNARYPLIWYLIKDSVKQEIDFKKSNNRLIKDITIIFCTETKQEYLAADRYENTFIPTLRPLYDSFLFYLKKSKEVVSKNGFYHRYYENLFWGREGLWGHEGNIFNDMLDAIIIDNLDLFIVETC